MQDMMSEMVTGICRKCGQVSDEPPEKCPARDTVREAMVALCAAHCINCGLPFDPTPQIASLTDAQLREWVVRILSDRPSPAAA